MFAALLLICAGLGFYLLLDVVHQPLMLFLGGSEFITKRRDNSDHFFKVQISPVFGIGILQSPSPGARIFELSENSVSLPHRFLRLKILPTLLALSLAGYLMISLVDGLMIHGLTVPNFFQNPTEELSNPVELLAENERKVEKEQERFTNGIDNLSPLGTVGTIPIKIFNLLKALMDGRAIFCRSPMCTAVSP